MDGIWRKPLIRSKLCPLTLSQSEVCKMKINMDGIILTSGIQTSMGGIILTSGIQISSTLEQSPCGNGSGINLILKSLFYSTDEHPRHCLPTDPVSPVAKETSSYHRNPDPYMIQENLWYTINWMHFICHTVSIWPVSLRN